MHCEDCRFWFEPESQCRRNAPLPVRGASNGSDTLWPHVGAQDWCGEYQPGYIDRRGLPSQARAGAHGGDAARAG
jgi:hypothetical protein